MKTTIKAPDSLLRKTGRIGLRVKFTITALVERRLRSVLGMRRRGCFVLRKASFRGDGLVAGRTLGDWETVRNLSYSARGAWSQTDPA